MTTIHKSYVDLDNGQIHVREAPARGEEKHAPLVCLHPAPYSGIYFETVMPMLNTGRRVIAPDYPGYGGSTAPDATPTIGDYASAILGCIDGLGIDSKVDLLGFHTGCLVGADMALDAPGRVRRLVLCDVPYFDPDMQAELVGKVTDQVSLSTELESLEKSWDLGIRRRADVMGLERAFEIYVEHLRAVPRDDDAFVAAFSYACEERFGALESDVTVIATKSMLREPSRAAARTIPGAKLVDADDIDAAVFEAGAEQIAAHISTVLEREQ